MLPAVKLRAGMTAAILAANISALAAGSAEFAEREDYAQTRRIEWKAQWREREFIRPHQDTRLLSMLTRRIAGQTSHVTGIPAACTQRGQLTPWKVSGRQN
jgi:hypothetical protein